jgi:chromatin remodeling complex protein RSC6
MYNCTDSKKKFKIVFIDRNTNEKWQDFYKKYQISNELSNFLKLNDQAKLYTKIEINKIVASHIRDNNLIWKDNKRIIKTNDELAELFKIKKSDNITFFNLQSFILPHLLEI